MSDPKRLTIYLTDAEHSLLEAISGRQDLSKSGVVRHLLIYQGLCGGDMPLTRAILDLPEGQRDKILAEILRRYTAEDPMKPQKFKEWVIEALGSADAETMEKGIQILIRKLLGE